VKLVLHLSHFNWAARPEQFAEVLADVAAFADEGGLDGIAVADHLWQHPIMGGPEANCLEAYTTLAFLAARTRSVRLLAVATGAHFRHPAVLAKAVTTLDVLSGERAWLGIGPATIRRNATAWACPSHRWRPATSCSRTPLRCAPACGPAGRATTGRSTVITSLTRGC
jgi:alkanesulfonate monooxygenase SsuD/methylene tetrahydromethanopterin reductase-like flavin-dependent oxidoreductase (luciferase family)